MTSPELRLRSDALQWRAIDGEIVALDAATTEYLAVNHSGAILWQQLAAGTSRAQLVHALMGAFELDEKTAKLDVDRFLAELRAQGVLRSS